MRFKKKMKGGYLTAVDRERVQRAMMGKSPLQDNIDISPLLKFDTPEPPPPSPDALRIMGLQERFDNDGNAHYYRISDGKKVPRSAFPSKPMQHYGPKALENLRRSVRNQDTFFISRDESGRKINVPEFLLKSHIKGLVDRKENTPRKFIHSTVTRKVAAPTKTRSKKQDKKSPRTYSRSGSFTRSNTKPKKPIKHTAQGTTDKMTRKKHKSKPKNKSKSK